MRERRELLSRLDETRLKVRIARLWAALWVLILSSLTIIMYAIMMDCLKRSEHLAAGSMRPCPACVERPPKEFEVTWSDRQYECARKP